MKKILVFSLLSALIAVSMVSGSYLGPELVTCWDFDCDTDWSYGGIWDRTSIGGQTTARHFADDLEHQESNLTQSISIIEEKTYNVTLDFYWVFTNFMATVDFNVYLGGTKQNVFDGEPEYPIGSTIFSYELVAGSDSNLILEVIHDSPLSTDTGIWLNSISVKEIIPPPEANLFRFLTADPQAEEILVKITKESKLGDAVQAIKILFKLFLLMP